jgi:hypothetical protein
VASRPDVEGDVVPELVGQLLRRGPEGGLVADVDLDRRLVGRSAACQRQQVVVVKVVLVVEREQRVI